MLALLLIALAALGVAALDDAASVPANATSTSTAPAPAAPTSEPGARRQTSRAAAAAPTVSHVPESTEITAGVTSAFVDTVPPLMPTFSQTPPSPSSSATSRFAWSSTDPTPGSGVSHYLCSKENGTYLRCSSPHTYDVGTTNNGQHQFSVVAVDGAGNTSPQAKYMWKVAKGLPAEFAIDGSVGGLVPGVWRDIPARITNPNAQAITVTSLTVAVTGTSGCGSANFETQASATPFVVPASATDHPVPPANRPRIRLKNLATDQGACKTQTVGLVFSGSANGS